MLAGGRSSRMGRDKAGLPFLGANLLDHSLDRLRGLGFQVAVAGLRDAALADPSAPVVPDIYPEAGPLGGIHAALSSLAGAPEQPVLFVPVDLPLLPPALLSLLWQRAEHTAAIATLPLAGGAPQPLCAVYRTSLAAGIGHALGRGDRKVLRVLAALMPSQGFDLFRVEALAPIAGEPLRWAEAHQWFTNLNTPDDWAALARQGMLQAPGAHLGRAEAP